MHHNLSELDSLSTQQIGLTGLAEPQTLQSPRTQKSPSDHSYEQSKTSELIVKLLVGLKENSVGYCHWKSNWQIDRWLAGDGDLDLLVSAKDVCKFTAVVSGLGFKKVLPPPEKDQPGVINYYGFDAGTNKLIHLHVHYRLVFGHDLTKNYHLPIERSIIDSAELRSGMPVTSPEIELILFVVRTILKVSLVENFERVVFGKHKTSFDSVLGEIEYLESQVEPLRVSTALRRLFPMVGAEQFENCVQVLRNRSSIFEQIRTKRRLEHSFSAYTRTSAVSEFTTRAKRRVADLLRRAIRSEKRTKQFESGGLMIAFVGGDGAGKSTCVSEMSQWLRNRFRTRTIHMGKPPKSILTSAVAGVNKATTLLKGDRGRNKEIDEAGAPSSLSTFEQLRLLCIARDRYRLFRSAKRFTANGGTVICDRFPLQQISLMDGPKIQFLSARLPERSFTRRLSEMERWYYRQILPPNLLIVLRVDPDLAVARKTDEAPQHVRPRSAELWNVDWKGTGAHIVDAGRDLPSVLVQLRSIIWDTV